MKKRESRCHRQSYSNIYRYLKEKKKIPNAIMNLGINPCISPIYNIIFDLNFKKNVNFDF